MSEADAVKNTNGSPATIQSLTDDLRGLGVSPGMTLLVHTSLSSLGWVCGGAVSVVLALEKAIGPEGTLVMPTHTGDLSEPSRWKNPPVPEHWWDLIRREMPAFDPDLTPTRGMGAVVECFRKQNGTLRSNHPTVSFAARGPKAKIITEDVQLDFPTGDDSPLGRMYGLDGWVLLLGTDFKCCTSLHLAEYRADYPGRKVIKCGSPVALDGASRWVEFDDIEYDDSDFDVIGADFLGQPEQNRKGRVASGTAVLMPMRSLVDYGVRWIEKNRGR
ncbi:TPA: AAC(3) family N-acetyltransferase [Thermoplasmata archaeon]|nr:AAC(3) family N-acetyltransferase [Thermoplasmata archaeon]